MRTRSGAKDGKPVYLVCFQHENIATLVEVEFPQLPASGAELVAELRKVCEINCIIAPRLKLTSHLP
jgi:hypothetical protein